MLTSLSRSTGFLLVAVLESCSSAEKLSELEAQWFGQAIRQAFAMPVETEDRHKMLLLVTAKLVSSAAMLRRCLNLGVETGEAIISLPHRLRILIDVFQLNIGPKQ